MALFTSYAPPGVYTSVILQSSSAPNTGTARIPVIIGEGLQYFTQTNVELFRGSSAVEDDQSVDENISNQVTGLTRNFQTTYYPVTDGTGKGVTTNDPTKIQASAIDPNGNQTPVTVISLNGATGQFTTNLIIPSGYELFITYDFKRGDTFIGVGGTVPYNAPENLLPQVPSTATLTVGSGGNTVVLGCTTPGATGNLVTLQLTSGTTVPDALAVNGAGTDAITININNSNSPNPRTLQSLINLVNAGIPTLDGGYLTVVSTTGVLSTALAATAAVPFAGGLGGNSNTVFKVAHTPIVDGSNGGVTTTNPAKVIVELNGTAVTVAAVNGAEGLITLAQPVPSNAASLTVQYYFNTWQNTFDLLPASNVGSIIQTGLGPNRSDFTQGTDYVLSTITNPDGTTVWVINWGASVNSSIGVSAAGEEANFTPAEVTTTLIDEQVFLRPLAGAVNGKNTVFNIPDTPTDGSGLSVETDNPSLIQVYVGNDPLSAFEAGAVRVASLSGTNQQVTLYNPPTPSSGDNTQPLQPVGVWGSYYRNTLADHQYTVKVVAPGYAGNGTFLITDELGRVAPLVTYVSGTVAQSANFASTGVVYPNNFADYRAQAGAAVDETVTLTFRNDGSSTITPATQAALASTQGAGTLTFTASIPGVGGNSVQIAIDAATSNPTPVVVNGDVVTIYSSWAGSALTLAQIVALFPSAETTDGGQILCVGSGTLTGNASTTAATNLTGGTDAVTAPVTHSYTVSSNNAKGSGTGSGNIGYLDQTYEDTVTGFRITVVNPADHVSYGVPTIPAGYNFEPGDTLVYQVNADSSGANAAVRNCGTPGVLPAQSNNLWAINGLKTTVISNFGSTAGDTVIVSTFNKSGNNPSVGEFYYVTFTVNKTAAQYGITLYTRASDAYLAYGQPSTINRVSLGVQLMAENGVQTFGVIQVPVVPGTNQGTSQDFINAIQTLTVNLPGLNQKANVIVPLSTDPTVHQFLSNQLTSQAGPRYKGEAIGFVGYDQFQTPATMSENAEGLNSNRMIAIGSPLAAISITNTQTGVSVQYAVSGEFMAAAMAGLNCNPSNDVATSLTNQNLVGFDNLLITYDDPTMDLMAANGLTCLLNNSGALKIRHYKTTEPATPLTSEPTVTTISDYVSQVFRSDLSQFIGRKLLDSLVTDIQVVCNARLNSLVNQQIIQGYQSLVVVQDPTDPTTVDVTVNYAPVFPLLYIGVTFTVQTNLNS